MLEAVLALSAAVVAFVEFAKSMLVKSSIFSALDEQTQSIILQLIAFLAGVFAAVSQNINIFPLAPAPLGVIGTGLIAATGSAGIHVILSLLGVRVGVSAEVAHRVDTRAQSADVAKRQSYAPFN